MTRCEHGNQIGNCWCCTSVNSAVRRIREALGGEGGPVRLSAEALARAVVAERDEARAEVERLTRDTDAIIEASDEVIALLTLELKRLHEAIACATVTVDGS